MRCFVNYVLIGIVLSLSIVSIGSTQEGAIRWLSERRASLLDIGRIEANIALLRMQQEGVPAWKDVGWVVTRAEFDAAKQQFVLRATLMVSQSRMTRESCLADLALFRKAVIEFVGFCPAPCINPGASTVARLFHLERFAPQIRPRALESQLSSATRFQIVLSMSPDDPRYFCESDPDGKKIRAVRAKR